MEAVGGLQECPNVPKTIATVITMKKATLKELDRDYGLEDLYDLLEIGAIESFNQRQVAKAHERERKKGK